jgi:hypothetical protein
MEDKKCPDCLDKLREAQDICGACGYKVELISEEKQIERFIKRPSPGGLFFTQAYAFGTRQYLWFIASLIPILGFVALGVMFLFGRRLSWRFGGWDSFEEYKKRQTTMDVVSCVWLAILLSAYLLLRFLKD